ncbi:MAG: DUF5916 domain-containing protein [Kofleriaceae bacterium]
MIRLLLVMVVLGTASLAFADDVPLPEAGRAHAIRRTGHIAIDGRLDEASWAEAPVQRGFSQRFPTDGGKAQLETSFAVMFDDQAVYVGVWADDPEPHKIRRLLTRRDVDSPGDAIQVGIDSYHDKRTAYVFMLNAAGVQRDMMLSDDSKEDWTWDAVWTGDVATTAKGWTAEFRIPLNQLRFPQRDAHEWGFQVVRVVSRTQEQAVWSPWPRSGSETVSKFGTVDGIKRLKSARRLELLPYGTAGVQSTPIEDTGDVDRDATGSLGLDLKYGLGPAFTLSATINPDFGQVEADPSQVNLSANEIFFQEKRPFFLEGADLFRLPIGSSNGGIEGAFYSRRIGATPPDSDYTQPVTIYTAAKLTGKTRDGWSVGILDAVTKKTEDETDPARPEISPLTNYMIARVKRDLREGKTALGASATAVNRNLQDSPLEGVLHDQAYSAGLQFEHRWGKNAWSATLGTVTSYVHGTPDAIARTQTSQAHLFQRPDAEGRHFDPTRTSLAGLGGGWMVGRLGDTKHWRFGIGGDFRTPGLELNDAGFMRNADRMVTFYLVEYHDEKPGDHILNYSINYDLFTVSTLEPTLTDVGWVETNANVQFTNYWSAHLGGHVVEGIVEPSTLRGGPRLHTDWSYDANVFVNTDNRKSVQVGFGGYGGVTPARDSRDGGADIGLTIQARSNIDLFVGPSWYRRDDSMQYIAEAADGSGTPHYIFGRINQTSLGMTMRMNWTFSPRLSLQAYAQPFVATGRYTELKDIDNPGAKHYQDRFSVLEGRELALMDEVYTANHNGQFSFDRPDFSFAQLRSNLVLRWEYRPGSSVFAIWSHGQTTGASDGRFQLDRDLRDLASSPGEDIVMVKANYWIGL